MIDMSNRARAQSQAQETKTADQSLSELGATTDRSALRSSLLSLATTPHAEVGAANRAAGAMTMSVADISKQLEGRLINQLT
jgi:hypothetical protein